MKICIFGAGAIGGMIGSLLQNNGKEVTLIARGEHYEEIKKNGLVFKSEEYNLDICQKFDVYNSTEKLGKFDLVINGLKAHSSNKTVSDVNNILDKNSVLLPTLNGIPWWFFYEFGGAFNNYKIKSVDPGNLQWNTFDPSRVIGCVVYPAAIIKKPGYIEHLEGKRLLLGEPNNLKTERVQILSKLLFDAGLKAPVSKNIRSDIWLKLIGNSSFNPLSIITQSTLKEMCESFETKSIVMSMMKEANLIADKLEIPIKLDIEKRVEGARLVGDHKTSTLQDYLSQKPLEIDALTKSLIELGDLTGISTPTIKTIYNLAKYFAVKNSCYPE
jgi:2-dehydropantoate 2-reductase